MTFDSIQIERIQDLDGETLQFLVIESEREGHGFITRLRNDWLAGQNRFDGPGEALFGAYREGILVGACGLNRDPYVTDPRAGRLRHLYVRRDARRQGVGTLLVRAVITTATGRFARLDLRTRSREAANFYVTCGFRSVESSSSTHRLLLDTGVRSEPSRPTVDLTAIRFETWIDGRIREAEARGHFDDLPGRGQPLENLTDDPDWWVKSKLQREGLSFVPESLRLRREVEEWRVRVISSNDERVVRLELRELNERIRHANSRLTSGPPSDLAPLDEETEVERWLRARDTALDGARSMSAGSTSEIEERGIEE